MDYFGDELKRIRHAHLETGKPNKKGIKVLPFNKDIMHYHYAETPGDKKRGAFKLHAFTRIRS